MLMVQRNNKSGRQLSSEYSVWKLNLIYCDEILK